MTQSTHDGTVVVLGHFPELTKHLDPTRYSFLLFLDSEDNPPPATSPFQQVVTVPGMRLDALAAAVREVARTPVVAVLAGRERYTVASAALGSQLDCPPRDVSVMETFENKSKFRRSVEDAGLSGYPYATRVTSASLEAMLASCAHGIVVKPARGNASKGVSLLRPSATRHELTTALYGAGERDVIAEAYVPGPGFSIEIVRSGGRTWFTNVTEKRLADSLPSTASASAFVPVEHRLPARMEPAQRADLLARTDRFLDHAGADTGLFHAEWQVPELGEPHFVECAARFPGGEIGAAIHAAYDVNLATLWIEALSETRATSEGNRLAARPGTDVPRVAPVRLAACMAFVADYGGRLVAYDGLDVVRAMDGVEEVTLRRRVGDYVAPTTDGSERLMMVVVTGTDRSEIEERIDLVRATIGVRIARPDHVGGP